MSRTPDAGFNISLAGSRLNFARTRDLRFPWQSRLEPCLGRRVQSIVGVPVDDALFESLVTAHYEPLYRFALTLARRGEEAADLTQETFYRYATKGGQLRDASKAKSWLFTTLYRQFLMRRRHEMRFPHSELTEAQADLPVVEPKAIHQLDAVTVMEALNNLDETYRAPLALFYLGDYSYREIAEVLDVPIGTVMSRLSRAKSMLRHQLAVATQADRDKIIQLKSLSKSQGSAL